MEPTIEFVGLTEDQQHRLLRKAAEAGCDAAEYIRRLIILDLEREGVAPDISGGHAPAHAPISPERLDEFMKEADEEIVIATRTA